MNKESVVLKNRKGKSVSFVKEQTEDEIILSRKVKETSSLANKRIIIHTIDLDKVRAFQNLKIDMPNKRSSIRKILDSVKTSLRRSPVANK